MPRIGANIQDVKTEYEYIEPGPYIWRVKEVDLQETTPKGKDGMEYKQVTHIIKSVCVSGPNGEETEHANKPVYDYINLYQQDGEMNQLSLSNLKRYFEACLGEGNYDANDPNTDDLKGREFLAECYIDTWKPKGGGEDRKGNKLRNMTILPVGGKPTASSAGQPVAADDWAVPVGG